MKKSTKLDKKYQKKYFEERQRDYSGDTRAPAIKRLSKKYIGKSVLDVGAGSGALVDIIPNSVGIDLAPQHARVIKGDITEIDYNDNSFDTVFALEILEHLDDQTLKSGLGEVKRVLKKGGYFIASMPYDENLENGMVMCPDCNIWFHKDGHVRNFNKKDVVKLLENNGFELLKIKILPLGSLGRHPFLGRFFYVFNLLGLGFKPTSIFLVAKNCD